MNGVMVISLDYELFWGVRDKRTINSYFENLNGVDCAIDLMLNLFSKEEIEVTWAVVGMLFLDNIETLKEALATTAEVDTKAAKPPIPKARTDRLIACRSVLSHPDNKCVTNFCVAC